MRKIKLSTNFAVFLLFFGVAAIEAFRSTDWKMVAFWAVIGIIFLVADNIKKNRKEKLTDPTLLPHQ